MDSEGLLINISAESTRQPNNKKKRRFGNDQKKRIRLRQMFKRQKTFNLANSATKTLKKIQSEKSENRKRPHKDLEQSLQFSTPPKKARKTESTPQVIGSAQSSPSSSKKGGDKSQNKLVISSLFNKNPDIPAVKRSEVQPINENVFTKSKFSELPLHPHLISCLEQKMCLFEMTEVQKNAIPLLLEGHDALIKSQTGSGKTLSYAVPIIQKLRSTPHQIKRSDGIHAIILVPTRELALQTLAVFKKLVQSCIWIIPGTVIGGESRKSEKARLRKGINILIATPGRLADHCESTCALGMNNLEFLIIDEADRLLDMGFEKDVAKIMTFIKQKVDEVNKQQTVLLSATLNSDVKRLAGVALTDPKVIDIASIESKSEKGASLSSETFSCPTSLEQFYVITPSKLKLVTFTSFILDKCKHICGKVVAFLPCQEVVQFYYEVINHILNRSHDSGLEEEEEESVQVFALHGDMKQQYRAEVFEKFSRCLSGVLLCTDVAARGLDFPNVSWIVQFVPPANTEDYIHRVGRTARIGSKGSSLIFLLPTEVKYLETLSSISVNVKPLEMESILNVCLLETELPSKRSGKQVPHTVHEAATAVQQLMEEWTYSDKERLAQAKAAYQSYVRAYATYPSSMKDVFHIKYLHLGHLAKSFCLREAPGALVGRAESVKLMKQKKELQKAQFIRSKQKRLKISEYSSGL